MKEIYPTIFASATPLLPSALHLVRISGEKSLKVLEHLAKGVQFPPRLQVLANLVDQGRLIDQALVTFFPSPNSFTGEDLIEISLHGSPLVVAALTLALERLGLCPAAPGEFSLRAFLNGKIDLVQAEAINDLIRAPNQSAKTIALRNIQGRGSQAIQRHHQVLSELAARLSVNIDYPEYYDIEEATAGQFLEALEELLAQLHPLLQRSQAALVTTKGVQVALVGLPNVGKSTLLNALIGADKAITSPLPGTTRDIVEGEKVIGGILFHFLDTAGIRGEAKEIERLGIAKTLQAIERSDVVVMVVEGDQLTDQEREILDQIGDRKHLIVRNKSDLNDINSRYLSISAISNDVEVVERELLRVVSVGEYNWDDQEFLASTRQIALLATTIEVIEEVVRMLREGSFPDLLLPMIEEARQALGKILGLEVWDDLEAEVFARFCVGK